MNMKIQRTYFIVWFLSIIPNFFLLTPTGLVWYTIFNTLHPVIIIVFLIWAISLNAQSLERQSGKEVKSGTTIVGGEKAMELSDYSSFIDDRSDISMAHDVSADADHDHRMADGKEGGKGF